MSTGLECNLVHVKSLGWFYILQSPFCSVSCWDWREEDPDADGPFADEDAAFAALRRRHANPGGYSISELHLVNVLADRVLTGIIEGALKRVLVRPEPPVNGVEMASDLIALGGCFKLDVGFFQQVTHADGTVILTVRLRRGDTETDTLSISTLWYPGRVHGEIRTSPGTSGAAVAFVREQITHAIGRALPDVSCEINHVAEQPVTS